jgi:hypothetical protein
VSKSRIDPNTSIGFPIICLTGQLDAVNLAITRSRSSLSTVHTWLTTYGELVLPDQEHSIRQSLGGHTTSVTQELGLYIYLSRWGFVNILAFEAPASTITVSRTLGGWPYDRYKKWVEA